MKKLLATIASLALTGGALLGVSAPASADEAAPTSETSVAEAPAEAPTLHPESAPAPEAAAPLVEGPAQKQEQSANPVEALVAEAPAAAESRETSPAAQQPVSGAAQPEQNERGSNKPEKVWVCKIVSSENSPSGYRLGSGNQPIHVSVNSLGDDVNDTGTFNDKQPSFVVASDDSSLCSRTDETVEEEIVCPSDESNGIVNITTTTTLFFGSTLMGSTEMTSTRDLTDKEMRACSPPPAKVYVCQFVPSEQHPGGWVLKRGSQPVLTSTSDLGPRVNNTGDFDTDQPSFIVASDDRALCESKQVERSTTIMCPSEDSDGYATITTVRSYFYGTVKVKETTRDKYRELTESEWNECNPYQEPLVATAEVSFEAATCAAPQKLILGSIVNATWGEVIDPEGPLNYSVTATADPGAMFGASEPALRAVLVAMTMTFTGALEPQLDPSSPECDLVTLGLVLPSVAFSQTSCSVAGRYTLGVAAGYDPAFVTFTVNGVSGVLAGTYPVAASGAVVVTTQVVAPNGFEFGWNDPPAFEFALPTDAACNPANTPQLPTLAYSAQLPTLAYTGGESAPATWWFLPISLIVLGGAAVYVRRRMDADVA